jgi:hypothetical protein
METAPLKVRNDNWQRGREITLEKLRAADGTTISLLGSPSALTWTQQANSLNVSLPPLKDAPAHVLKITPAPQRIT